jgi:hypothetical protein
MFRNILPKIDEKFVIDELLLYNKDIGEYLARGNICIEQKYRTLKDFTLVIPAVYGVSSSFAATIVFTFLLDWIRIHPDYVSCFNEVMSEFGDKHVLIQAYAMKGNHRHYYDQAHDFVISKAKPLHHFLQISTRRFGMQSITGAYALLESLRRVENRFVTTTSSSVCSSEY